MTHVALSEGTRSFRLEGIEQLQRYQVHIPEELLRELYRRKETEVAWEEAKSARNDEAAFERRFQPGAENASNERK